MPLPDVIVCQLHDCTTMFIFQNSLYSVLACTQSGAIQEKCGNPVCCPDCGNLSGIILKQQLQLIPPLHEMYIAC